jgi:hypothetical protein
VNTLAKIAEAYQKHAERIQKRHPGLKLIRKRRGKLITIDLRSVVDNYIAANIAVQDLGREPAQGFIQRVIWGTDNGTQWG